RGTIPWEERSAPVRAPARTSSTTSTTSPTATTSLATRALSSEERDVKNALDLAFQNWKGTPYILGGTGYNGVDCSSFMQIVFEDYFQIELPRNTSDQI